MHNWRLLLLAFLAVLHPITSFTERNFVDGREQCCDRNSLLRDSRFTYGSIRTDKLSENHLSRNDIRKDRRYEVRRDNTVLTRPSADRRLVEFRSEREVSRLSPERATTRFIRTEFRQENIADNRRVNVPDERERRIAHRISSRDISRDMRNRDVSRMRYSRESNIRQHERENREFSRERTSSDSRDNRITRNINNERRFRDSMDSQRETRRNRDNSAEINRVQESRKAHNVLQRARHDVTRNDIFGDRQDRRVVRERMDERRARSKSRLQLNREHRSLDRHVRDTTTEDNRRSSLRFNSIDRIRDVREDRLNLRDISDKRQHSRRDVHERNYDRRLNRDEHRVTRDRMTTRQDLRERNLEERRNLREFTDRSRSADIRYMRLERADTRRESRIDEGRFQVRSREERAMTDMRLVDSRRVTGNDLARDRDVVLERRDRRTMDRRDIRDTRREVKMIRSVDARERDVSSNRAEYRITRNSERVLNDALLRSNTRFVVRDFASNNEKNEPKEESTPLNWQYVFYTLQGLYLSGVLMQILSQSKSSKKSRGFTWLTAPRSLVKVD